MAPRLSDRRVRISGHNSAEHVPRAESSHGVLSKPFHQTRLGRLPPELREKIFKELLATPPSYAGHDFTSVSPELKASLAVPNNFVHIKASWYQVTRTCRQIYLEAHPVFFASKACYLSDAQELVFFLEHRWQRIFRHEVITALCLKALVTYSALYTKEKIDQIFSDPIDYRRHLFTRQQLEAQTHMHLGTTVHHDLLFRKLKSLKMVCICMRAGEELLYIDFLYGITSIGRGLIEFVNATHWLVRPQRAEDTWRNQYACFCHGNYGTGKDGEKIPYDVLNIERKVTDIDSRAPGLKEGDERYVEVEIRRVVESLARGLNVQATHDIQQEAHSIQTTDGSLQVNLAEDTSDAESASDMNHTDVNLSDEETQDTQPGTRQEQINNNASAIHLGWDNGVAMLETASTPIDQTLASGPLTEDSGSLQSKKGTDLELRLPELVSGVNTLTRLETESNQANDPSLSGSFAAEAHNRPPGIKSDQQILHQRLSPNTDDYNRQAQTDTKPVDPPPYSADLYSNRLDAETESGGVPMQENLIEMKEGDCPTKIKYLSSEGKLPLLKIVLKPNPYTEEEMQSYYKWQCPTYAQTREALFPNFHQETAPSSESTEIPERHVKDSSVAKRTATREEIGLPAVSPFRPGSPSKSVRLGAPFLLCLLIVIMAFALSGWRTYVERTRDPVNSEHPLFL